ncbi:hypothetical protein [uncultured Lutibacter sp.]|uniref:hypothetical protein n=1 Tax=uncultured Lutibacter sp. TaxID=437739 RepID=UPI002607A157|nr:hypothetical protein [uncultured Lutibacter sp.]
MKIFVPVLVIFFSVHISSQEIGSVKKANHSIKLVKTSDSYSLIYSDLYTINQNAFQFNFKETVYNIIMDGFEKNSDHQIIVQTNNDTIVKFEFKKIKGQKMLKIKQNNLTVQTFGVSTFYTQKDILRLFGNSNILN